MFTIGFRLQASLIAGRRARGSKAYMMHSHGVRALYAATL